MATGLHRPNGREELIEMVGPGPSAGTWTEVNGSTSEWEWIPKKTEGKADPFILEQGKWIYKGREPEFIWKTNRWQFVSNAPSLGFYFEGALTGMRFQLEKTTLLFAENSQQAKNKIRLIQATFDTDVRFDSDKKADPKDKDFVNKDEKKRAPGDPKLDVDGMGSSEREKNPDALGSGSEIKFVEAIQLQSDCWILENKKDARNVMGRWLIEIIGPSPSVGSWTESKKSAGEWEWTPKKSDTKDPFIVEQGTWTYKGREPEFIWKTNRWQFVGRKPVLGFYYEGELYGMRFRLDKNKTLLIAENSERAKGLLPLIQATFACEAHFEAEKAAVLAPKNYIDKDEAVESKTKDFLDEDETPESKTKDFLNKDETQESKTKDFLDEDETQESKTKDFLNKDETKESKTKDFSDEDEAHDSKTKDFLNKDETKKSKTKDYLNEDETKESKTEDLIEKAVGEGPDWNGSDALKKENIFNNGGGIGLGVKKEREGYDFDDPDYSKDAAAREARYKAGAEAFVSMVLTVKMKSGPLDQPGDWIHVELLENTGKEVMVETSMEQLDTGTPVSFQFLLKDGAEETASEVAGTVRINEKLDDAAYLVSVVFEPKDQVDLKKIATMYESRQQEAHDFMKAAKGF